MTAHHKSKSLILRPPTVGFFFAAARPLQEMSFRPKRADAFVFAFAPANASALVVEEPWLDVRLTATIITGNSFFARTTSKIFNHQRKTQ
jgi:hypothetical protein